VGNKYLEDALTLVGIPMRSASSLLNGDLDKRYEEVNSLVKLKVDRLDASGDSAMGVTDGWKNKHVELGASLVDFSSLLPDGGRIFHDVKDVSELVNVGCAAHVQQVSLVLGDSLAIKMALFKQQDKRNLCHKSVRPNCPTRFAVQLFMAKDVDDLHDPLRGLVESDDWDELRKASKNSSVFEHLKQPEWWKALRAVIRLLQPICDYIHKLEADTPYLSQMLPIWDNLMSGAEAWVQSLPGGAANPLAHGVLKLFAERRAKSYSPVMAAAYLLDPVNFTLATPSRSPWQLPPFERLIGDQEQDAISTVVRLSKHLLPGQTAAQVQAAVALEVTRLQVCGWKDDKVAMAAALFPPGPPNASGEMVVEAVAARRNFWRKAANNFPLLAAAACKLLAVHVTSAASERNWSAWGRLYTAARNRLGMERAKKLIFIKANADCNGCNGGADAELLALMGE
ncbi:hypothetical protein QJQ45_029258, partial [Haematococcus lacustris]